MRRKVEAAHRMAAAAAGEMSIALARGRLHPQSIVEWRAALLRAAETLEEE